MAANLDNVMTWAQACEQFASEILPHMQTIYEQDGVPDWPARSETWNNWTDSLCKDGQISDWQYENWSQSPLCE
jgi:hypothetical protein